VVRFAYIEDSNGDSGQRGSTPGAWRAPRRDLRRPCDPAITDLRWKRHADGRVPHGRGAARFRARARLKDEKLTGGAHVSEAGVQCVRMKVGANVRSPLVGVSMLATWESHPEPRWGEIGPSVSLPSFFFISLSILNF
jgi:hypothetical protein